MYFWATHWHPCRPSGGILVSCELLLNHPFLYAIPAPENSFFLQTPAVQGCCAGIRASFLPCPPVLAEEKAPKPNGQSDGRRRDVLFVKLGGRLILSRKKKCSKGISHHSSSRQLCTQGTLPFHRKSTPCIGLSSCRVADSRGINCSGTCST